MMIRARILLAILPACFTTPALALCPHPAPKVCSAYFENDTVYTGKVSRVEPKESRVEFTLDVMEVFRGHPASVDRVWSDNDSGRWVGEEGKTYVVFASSGRVRAHCSALDEPKQVRKVVREIRHLARTRTSRIEGLAKQSQGEVVVSEGAKLAVVGSGRTWDVVSDARGKFSVDVPPGRYDLRAEGFGLSDYGWGNLAGIRLVAGQCAQFELMKR